MAMSSKGRLILLVLAVVLAGAFLFGLMVLKPKLEESEHARQHQEIETAILEEEADASDRTPPAPPDVGSLLSGEGGDRSQVVEELTGAAGAKPEGQETAVAIQVDQMPELVGGVAGLQKKIKYPEAARDAGVQGMVVIEFVVDVAGRVTSARVVKGIGGGCDEEALRVVNEARFSPGIDDGQPTAVQMELPIRFRLPDR